MQVLTVVYMLSIYFLRSEKILKVNDSILLSDLLKETENKAYKNLCSACERSWQW